MINNSPAKYYKEKTEIAYKNRLQKGIKIDLKKKKKPKI